MQTGFSVKLQEVVLFPTLSWDAPSEKKVGNRAVHELLGLRIEFEMCIKLLCNHTKAEYLAERTGNAEW